MTALVTGGAGFIGSHVAGQLVNTCDRVVILDDLSGGFKENIPAEALLVKGSINDVDLLKQLFRQYKFDYVFHLAAYAAEGLSHFIRKFNYENNLIGSINLLNESVKGKVKCFVFTSSIAVYGEQEPPFNEELIPRPEDPYGVAKYAVEMDLHLANKMWGLNYIIFRPHNVYGENQNIADKYRNVLGIFMNQILQGKELTIFGDGEQTRAFTYIGDIAPAIADSVFNEKAYNQIFNIGTDHSVTVNEAARLVSKAMGANSKLCHLPLRNEVKHAYSIHKKVKELLGQEAKTSLEDGIANMTEWVKRIGSRKSCTFSNIEIHQNLPKSWQE
ncbi:MAG: NAD-dependent epimerase/dehydratase family protein [bacterium]|nr:NAD-dependent epimerase/dehydratase family protein [bacterium]